MLAWTNPLSFQDIGKILQPVKYPAKLRQVLHRIIIVTGLPAYILFFIDTVPGCIEEFDGHFLLNGTEEKDREIVSKRIGRDIDLAFCIKVMDLFLAQDQICCGKIRDPVTIQGVRIAVVICTLLYLLDDIHI